MSLTVAMCRLFVIIANILTTISGLILIGLGLYGLFSPEMRFYSNAFPLATIILGILVFVISITGCLGAIAENRPTLITIEIILDKSWDKAYKEHPSIIRDIEDEYSCCGFRNTTDRAILTLIFSYILITYLPTPEEREREYRAEHERLVRSYRDDSSAKTRDSHKYGSGMFAQNTVQFNSSVRNLEYDNLSKLNNAAEDPSFPVLKKRWACE
ncbi:2600_t:CDS:2 [Diversispora eburnea]|uniref:2600_t:CDS:1 n=1 Tax=Diversispora eburnea TaxID=1213867 RepID=A0A9N9A365_9GLOM|nr:2600_t:CDS:2 [Diversispora eburnea]